MAQETTHCLKLGFYYILIEKWKRHIFTTILMHPNFIHFCQKIIFKGALGSFSLVSDHF